MADPCRLSRRAAGRREDIWEIFSWFESAEKERNRDMRILKCSLEVGSLHTEMGAGMSVDTSRLFIDLDSDA